MSENKHLESVVADMLSAAHILFVPRDHDPESTKGCAFYLPLFDVRLEIVEFMTERVSRRVSSCDNAILLVGERAAATFVTMMRPERGAKLEALRAP